MSVLFSKLKLGPIELTNRIVVSPMCQYSSNDGTLGDWHLAHLGGLALSGAGMLTIEATHVSREGRITPGCAGLYSDENETAFSRVLAVCRSASSIPIALQLNHAGRKGSTSRPWDLPVSLPAGGGAWQTIAPSATPFADSWHAPRAAIEADMRKVVADFGAAAKRASRLDLAALEIHMAHGYLLNQFLSPLVNNRSDAYGGSLEKRMRLPLEVFRAVRAIWPSDRALGAKIPGSDYAEGGWSADDAAVLATDLKRAGADYVMVSGGGTVAHQQLPVAPAMNLPIAETVKVRSGITTGVVGMIASAHLAEKIICEHKVDFIAVARGFLSDPRWAVHAAAELGIEIPFARQYERATPANWPPARRVSQ